MKMMKMLSILVVCFLSMATVAHATVISSWDFGDDPNTAVAVDSVGGNDLTLMGGAAFSGGAMSFNGTDSYLTTAATAPDLNRGTNDLSIKFKLKLYSSARQFILNKRNPAGGEWIAVEISPSGFLLFNATDNDGGVGNQTSYAQTKPVVGQWDEWEIIVPNDAPVVFKRNGVVDTHSSYQNIVFSGDLANSAPLELGRWSGGGIYLAGELDDVSISLTAKANAVNPLNNEVDVPLDVLLEWEYTLGDPDSQTIYFKAGDPNFAGGTVYTDSLAGTLKTWDPPVVLELNTTYYWRVDSSVGGEVVEGEVWNFTTIPPKPYGPTPADNEPDAAANTTLSFYQSPGITSAHDVYFGTDPNSLPLIASTTDAVPVIDPDPAVNNLLWGATYYWRVDTIGITGDMWSFTVGAPNCDPPLAGDVTGDCKVDMNDFALMAQDWLECTLTNGVCE